MTMQYLHQDEVTGFYSKFIGFYMFTDAHLNGKLSELKRLLPTWQNTSAE